jgi:L-ascorbate metabolism protein UlaG (beta-lactamase superfamily)
MAHVRLRYLGNSAFEVLSEQSTRILIDPHIRGNPLCPISRNEVEPADLILVTHGAHDHMGDTLELARKFGCPVVCDPGVAHYLKGQGIPEETIILMVWGQVWKKGGLKIRALEAKHVSFRSGSVPITGLPLSFILYTESDLRIYHSGDTSIFSDLQLFGDLYQPDIGMILVGNYPGFLSELSPEEAALAVKWLSLKVAIPMHYEKGSPEPHQFQESVNRESPQTQVILMEPGEWKSFRVSDFVPRR